MEKLVFYEIKKIFAKKIVWLIIVLLLLMQIFTVAYTLQHNEAEQTVQTSQELTQRYEDRLAEVKEQQQKFSQNAVFSGQQTYARRNIQKTYDRYKKLKKQVIPSARSSDVTSVTDVWVTNLIFLILIFGLGVCMSSAEQSCHSKLILSTMKKGGFQIWMAKVLALALIWAVIVSVFSLCSFCVNGCLYGIGDLGRPIQSLNGYLRSPYHLSAGSYLVSFLALKYLAVLSISILFLACCMLVRYQTLIVLGSAVALGVEQYLYQKIAYHSPFAFFRQFNLMAGLDTKSFFQNYHTINVFGYAVSTFQIFILQILITIGIGCLILHITWTQKKAVPAKHVIRDLAKPRKKVWSTRLYLHELRKLFLHQKAIVVFVILLLLQCACYYKDGIELSGYEISYEQYSKNLEGGVTKENAEYVNENYERNSTERMEKLQNELQKQVERGEISQSYADYVQSSMQLSEQEAEAWKMIKEQYHYLMQQKERGRNVQYLSLTTWKYLFCGREHIIFDLFKMLIVLTVGLGMLYPFEFASHMQIQIRAAAEGKKRDFRAKIVSASVFTTAAWAIAVWPVCIQTWHFHGLPHAGWAAASLPWFSYLPDHISIGMALAGMQLIFLGIAFLWMAGVLALSKKTKSIAATLAISFAVMIFLGMIFLL